MIDQDGKIEYRVHKIEFQMRGMPHLHGVFWLTRKEVKKYMNQHGEFDNEGVVKLIEEWISVELNTGNEKLDSLVKEV